MPDSSALAEARGDVDSALQHLADAEAAAQRDRSEAAAAAAAAAEAAEAAKQQ